MSKYSVALFQYACPDLWSRLSGRTWPLRAHDLEEIWNASYNWCQENGFNFVQVQFISIGPTFIYIIHEEK